VTAAAGRASCGLGSAASLEAPGKSVLLARGFGLAGLRPGARALDVGCGRGVSVEYLRRSLGLRAVGLDLSASPEVRAGIPRLRADAGRLPIAGGALEAVLLECVLSLLPDRQAVLRECACALAPSGKLVVADLYDRVGAHGGGPRGTRACSGAELLPREDILALVASSGFDVLRWEDHSGVLKEALFRWIMGAGEAEELPPGVLRRDGGEAAAAAGRLRFGYCLVVAARRAGPDRA
jgi:ubiquinone/menaquinone biosynthesis C-methylase UbiE